MRRLLFIAIFCSVLTTNSYASGGAGGTSAYFNVPQPFIVNLVAENGDIVFLQVNAQFKTTKTEQTTLLTTHLPAIQHSMMMLLSEQSPKNLRTVKGKKRLREQAVKELQEVMQSEVGEPVIEEIFFTGFIIQ